MKRVIAIHVLWLAAVLIACKHEQSQSPIQPTKRPISSASFDSIVNNWYVRGGKDRDSLLQMLYEAGSIDGDYYAQSVSESKRASLRSKLQIESRERDAATVARLRSTLKHKFVLDFLISRFGMPSEFQISYEDSRFSVQPRENHFIVESLRYGLLFNLYAVESLPDNMPMYVLDGIESDGVQQLYLFDEDKQGNALLDSLSLDRRSYAEIRTMRLNAHIFLRIDLEVHGTGYLDEQIMLLGIINKIFQNVFSTSSLMANDWATPASGYFDRRVGRLKYSDLNGDGLVDIERHVNQDVVYISDSVQAFDFRKGQPVKQTKTWTEVYLWNEKTLSFNFDQARSSIERE